MTTEQSFRQRPNTDAAKEGNGTVKLLYRARLLILFIIWNYGLFTLYYGIWVVGCYFYLHVFTATVMPPSIQHEIECTPEAGKIVVIMLSGRKVTLKVCRCVQRFKARYITGE